MLSDLEALARQIAPLDLTPDIPFYVIDSTASPDCLAGGMYSPTLDLSVRPWLESQGRWAGRGPCVFIGDAMWWEFAMEDARRDQILAREVHRDRTLAVFAHELAHAFQRPFDLTPPGDPPHATAPTSAALKSMYEEAYEDLTHRGPWTNHEFHFIRLLCHVIFRLERLVGMRLPENFAFSANYGVGPLSAYSFALAHECEAMQSESFALIREARPPDGFMAIWSKSLLKSFEEYLEEQSSERDTNRRLRDWQEKLSKKELVAWGFLK